MFLQKKRLILKTNEQQECDQKKPEADFNFFHQAVLPL
jgi:hypothetical protein